MANGAGGGVTVTASFLGAQNVAQQMNVLGRAAETFANKTTSKLGGMFGAVAIGALAFNKISNAMEKNMATAKQVSGLAIKFNVDPSMVASMKIAADDAGVSIRSLMMASKQFGKVAMEGMSTKHAEGNFKQLGISSEKLALIQAKPMKFLPEAAVALANIADETERSAAGSFLFGRQYQQIAPLLEKLGNDEEERAKFLNNNNAMTNEQIKLNKEAARIQSELNDSVEKLAAAGAPVLNWVMSFASYLANALATMTEIITKAEKIKNAKIVETQGKALNYLTGLERQDNLRIDKINKQKDAGETVSTEDEEFYNKIRNAGGTAAYSEQRFKKALRFSELSDRPVGAYEPGEFDEYEKLEKELDVNGRNSHLLLSLAGLKKSKIDMDAVQLIIDKNKGKTEGVDARGKVIANVTTVDKDSGSADAGTSVGGSILSNTGVTRFDTAKRLEDEAFALARSRALEAFKAAARLKGMEYDVVTGKEVTPEKLSELKKQRTEKLGIEAGTFVDSKGVLKAEKDKKAADRALARAERSINETGMTPVEKAEEALRDAKDKAEEILDEDIKPKEVEIEDRQIAIDLNKKKLSDLEAKREKNKAETEAALAKELAASPNLTPAQIENYSKDFRANRPDLTQDELEQVSGTTGQIKGDEKLNAKDRDELTKLQTTYAGSQAQINQATDARNKAQEAFWAKEKSLALEVKADELAYEREIQEYRYKEMKFNGASNIEILKEKFNFELKKYQEVAAAQEQSVAEIEAKRKVRGADAYGAAMNKGLGPEAAEAARIKAEKMTDEETSETKRAREAKDKSRAAVMDSLYAMDKKPETYSSDLGKMGGGRVVQFSVNPVDEIKKTNSILTLILKEAQSGSIQQQPGAGVLPKTFSPDVGVFGADPASPR